MTALKFAYTPLKSKDHNHSETNDCDFSYCHEICTCFLAIFILLIIAVIVLSLVLPWIFAPCYYNIRPVHSTTDAPISTIAFGSCASSSYDIPIFNDIDADVIVFLGDNIYADTGSPRILQMIYNRLSCKHEFQRLVERTKYVLAIWDDHDYGNNDIGADNPIKYESQSTFLNFWRIPSTSERRRQSGGVYGSYRFKMPNGQETVSIIMPDLRFFREPLKLCDHGEFFPRENCYCPTNRSLLGGMQWAWFENAINRSQQSDALTIIASSSQFGHSANGYESWTNFPLERARLQALLNPSKSIVISGDVHWGEISKLGGLIDVTSSGFSEVDRNVLPNNNRVGNAIPLQNYGMIHLLEKTVSIHGIGKKELLSISW